MAPHESTETTHYSIVDKDGNAVSTTYTVNGRFWRGGDCTGTGFFLNNEMDDFAIKPGVKNLYGLVQGATNAIAPKKQPLSSMSPSLITKDGKTFMVLGSPGGSRIITITLQTALNVIDHGAWRHRKGSMRRASISNGYPTRCITRRGGLADTLKILRERLQDGRTDAVGRG